MRTPAPAFFSAARCRVAISLAPRALSVALSTIIAYAPRLPPSGVDAHLPAPVDECSGKRCDIKSRRDARYVAVMISSNEARSDCASIAGNAQSPAATARFLSATHAGRLAGCPHRSHVAFSRRHAAEPRRHFRVMPPTGQRAGDRR